MRTSIVINDALMKQAMQASGTVTWRPSGSMSPMLRRDRR